MANVDNDFDSKERSRIKFLLSEHGVNYKNPEFQYVLGHDALVIFNEISEEKKVFLFCELARFICSDDIVHENELAFINKIARNISFSFLEEPSSDIFFLITSMYEQADKPLYLKLCSSIIEKFCVSRRLKLSGLLISKEYCELMGLIVSEDTFFKMGKYLGIGKEEIISEVQEKGEFYKLLIATQIIEPIINRELEDLSEIKNYIDKISLNFEGVEKVRACYNLINLFTPNDLPKGKNKKYPMIKLNSKKKERGFDPFRNTPLTDEEFMVEFMSQNYLDSNDIKYPRHMAAIRNGILVDLPEVLNYEAIIEDFTHKRYNQRNKKINYKKVNKY